MNGTKMCTPLNITQNKIQYWNDVYKELACMHLFLCLPGVMFSSMVEHLEGAVDHWQASTRDWTVHCGSPLSAKTISFFQWNSKWFI